MKVTAIVEKGLWHHDEFLLVRRNGCLTDHISIDRTYYGADWCRKHDMVVTETIVADNGEKFDIWRKERELVCAIPVES